MGSYIGKYITIQALQEISNASHLQKCILRDAQFHKDWRNNSHKCYTDASLLDSAGMISVRRSKLLSINEIMHNVTQETMSFNNKEH